MRRTLIEVLVMMLITYITFFLLSAIYLAALEFILSNGDVKEYLLELKGFAKIIIIPSIGIGIKYLIDKYYV